MTEHHMSARPNSFLRTAGATVWEKFLALRLYQICSLIWRWMPLELGYRLADLVADFVYFGVWRARRQNVISNMGHVLGADCDKRTIRRYARQSVRNYFRYLVDFLRFPGLSDTDIVEAIGADDWEQVEKLSKTGCGLLFVGLHFGNWDLAGAAVSLRGYRFNAVADTFKPKALDDEIQGTRRAKGMQIWSMGQAVRAILRALRANEMVGLLIDRPLDGEGVTVRFFDGDVRVPAGPALVALRTGARIVPCGLVRLPEKRYELVVDDSFHYEVSGRLDDDVLVITQGIMTSLERFVRRFPDQWYMFRKMWQETDSLSVRHVGRNAAVGPPWPA